jgi:hypothetical protein
LKLRDCGHRGSLERERRAGRWRRRVIAKRRFCGYFERQSRARQWLKSAASMGSASFYLWKKKYAGLGLSELRELRQLREENNKLKRLVADLSLDRHILQEIVAKKL